MARVAVVLALLVVACVCATSTIPQRASRDCAPNAEFKECGRSCEPTCKNPTPSCIQKCVPACNCKPGYVRNSNNECILKSDCPI